jgi:hypothetical protein
VIPRFDGLIPFIGFSAAEYSGQTLFGGQAQYLGEYVLSDKMGSFVHVVYLFCGKNKLTTIRGLCGPLYNAFYPEIFSDNSDFFLRIVVG